MSTCLLNDKSQMWVLPIFPTQQSSLSVYSAGGPLMSLLSP